VKDQYNDVLTTVYLNWIISIICVMLTHYNCHSKYTTQCI